MAAYADRECSGVADEWADVAAGVVVATGVPLSGRLQVDERRRQGGSGVAAYADRECSGVADEWADVAAGGCGGYGRAS